MRCVLALAVALTWFASAPGSAQTVDFGRYRALVIGINDYKYLPDLQTAVNDASAIHDVLRREYAYESTLLLNPNRAQLVQALDDLRAELTENDNLLIFYAGHGYLDRPTDEGFWLTTDAKEDSQVEWVAVSAITRLLKASPAKHALVIADSCYSGVLARDAPILLKVGAEREAEIRRIASKRARKALTSGGLEPVNDGGGDGHSVFSRALIEALRENRQIVDGFQLYQELRRKVVLNAQQTPQYSDIRFSGDEGGDYLFVPMQTRPVVEVPAPTASQTTVRAQGDEPSAGRIELAFWQSIQDSKLAADFEAYLATYPDGKFAALARNRLAVLGAAKPAAPPAPAPKTDKGAAEIAYWRKIQNSDNVDDFQAYLEAYPDGAFKPIAENRIRQLRAPARSAAVVKPAPPTPPLVPVEGYFVVIRTANVRAGPSVEESVVTSLRRGDEVYVSSKTEDGNWLRIERDGKRLGFMYATLLQSQEDWQAEESRRRTEEEGAKRRAEEEAARRRADSKAAQQQAEQAAQRRAEEEAARRRADEAASAQRQRQLAVVVPPKPAGYDGTWKLQIRVNSFERGDHGQFEKAISITDGQYSGSERADGSSFQVRLRIVEGQLEGSIDFDLGRPWVLFDLKLSGNVRDGSFQKQYYATTHDGHESWADERLTLDIFVGLTRN